MGPVRVIAFTYRVLPMGWLGKQDNVAQHNT